MKSFLLAALLGCTSLLAQAHEYDLGAIHIVHPWARATPPGAQTAGGFLKLENKGGADRLLSASAGVSEIVEVHEMSMDNNVMKMRKLDAGLELPAGKTVELKPGSFHIMFINLKAPLKQGDKFPLTLKFEKAGTLKVDVAVEAMTASSAPAAGHDHGHMH